jgi:hypothetical protein
MGGSVTLQFLWQAYNANLAQAVTTEATQILGAIAATAQGAVMLYVIILGKRLIFDNMSAGEGVTRLIRAVIVVSLLTAANYQTFVATPITTTIPNFINNMVNGQQGLTGAQGWDALINKVDNFSAQIHAQTVGIAYIADRVTVWIIGVLAKVVIVFCYFIYSLATATADLLVPIGAIIIPFYLFEATRSFAERWVGKIISLFLVMIITLMLGQIVVFQDAQFLQKYATNIGAAEPAGGFNMLPDNDNIGIGPTTAGGVAGATINVDSAIGTLGNALVVFLYGMFLMAISTGIALYIGGSSGFSAGPAFAAIARTLAVIARALL